MSKIFEDELKYTITINDKEFNSIFRALFYDYQYYKAYGEGNGTATYRNEMIRLDLEDGNKDYDSLYSNVKKQVSEINEEKDGE